MVLAKDEMIIKSWDYSSSLSLDVTTSNLTVTNKRIISTIKGRYKGSQREVMLKDVKGVSFVHGVHRPWLSWVFILFGACLVLFSFFFSLASSLALDEEEVGAVWAIFGACCILGIPLILVGIMRMLGGIFGVVITLEGKEGTPLECGAVGVLGKRLKFDSGLLVKVDDDVAEKIVDYLGAIILDNK